jgi:hypothetical protein
MERRTAVSGALQAAATTGTVSLRIRVKLLAGLRRKAAEQDLPFRAWISSINYEFGAGRLVDAPAIRRVVAALK